MLAKPIPSISAPLFSTELSVRPLDTRPTKPDFEPHFGGRRVAVFEATRAAELGRLIEAHAGVPVEAPAVKVEHLDPGPDLVELATRLREDDLDAMLFLTSTGVEALPTVMAPIMGRDGLARRLKNVRIGSAGPRTTRALEETLGLTGALEAPEPYGWETLVAALERADAIAGQGIAVQESGLPHPALRAALMDAGAHAVLQVALYRWRLPDDVGPMNEAMDRLVDGSIRVALFTSGAQIDHLMAVAAERDLDEPLRQALREGVVGALGSVSAERLRAFGIEPDIIPARATLAALVEGAADRAGDLLEEKNA